MAGTSTQTDISWRAVDVAQKVLEVLVVWPVRAVVWTLSVTLELLWWVVIGVVFGLFVSTLVGGDTER